ncbi:MAG: 4-(cytidine 5'-diphospho)-2-C-methyl-D-erythritol kinase [Clostridiales bacterium]|jgi:4-diphosphocytidyl-2-C-methyl-D-erythritol kinase|nr:4-(cytidine 5'-diphospho)-2-C-methyl-D-erythritol kinase [Clostridiales bacterium]
MKITVDAPAKINLTLDIIGKRNDGYHLVKMLMQSVDLCDSVTVWDTGDNDVSLSCDQEGVPDNQSNIAYKAAAAFFAHTGLVNPGIGIKIKKRIPIAAGLAGGSADGAAVLVALNHLMGTELTLDELCDIGETIGADLPFCLVGGTMVASGIGTILTPAPDLPDCYLVIAKPPIQVSTKEAYSLCDDRERWQPPYTDDAVEAVCDGSLPLIGRTFYNEFEELLQLKEVERIKQIMKDCGALGASMSGSGPSVFGLFSEKGEAEDCADVLKEQYQEVFVCRPMDRGCTVED